jgi:hypothetical protein
VPEAPASGTGWINGGDRFEVHRRLRLGDECGARVTGQDGDRLALEVWTASAGGTRTTIGTAEVALTEGRS